jgi:DNA mismatch endonuclease (patch repair protein)
MIRFLRKHRISGWRRNQAVLGKPGIVFSIQKIALFLDGCFWHACPKHSNMPKNNPEFWAKKLQQNKDRDRYVSPELGRAGWIVDAMSFLFLNCD